MSLLDDILKALDRWEEWRRLRAAPARLDAVERRLAALEAGLARRPAPETCPFCRTGALRLVDIVPEPGVFAALGAEIEVLHCENPACGREHRRPRPR